TDKKGPKIEREIPDVAAEAAQSRSLGRPPGLAKPGADMGGEGLGAVLKEIEDCYRLLRAAKS
ncbi:MAG: hypothetical protein WBB50_03940, partial [Methyloceanibacter sp.]